MRIGELAQATATSTRALRHYEEAGLLGSARAANGYRIYPGDAVLRVRTIRELLAIGFTTNDVRYFLGFLDRELPTAFGDGDDGGCATAMRVAGQRLTRLRDRIDTLTDLHERLAARMPSVSQ
jgi:MerR family copper efflux transcriptional regulator